MMNHSTLREKTILTRMLSFTPPNHELYVNSTPHCADLGILEIMTTNYNTSTNTSSYINT